MRKALLALALFSLPSLALADGAHMKPGTYPEKTATWKQFAVRDIVLDGDFNKASSFTCGPDPASQGFTTYRHTCVKFLDERCKGKPTKIHHIRSMADVPNGQSCFMDEGSGGTYLDRKFQSAPLSYISIVATDTSAPVIYEVNYTFAKDQLTLDSNLGKALIAKYGKPTSTNPPIGMGWSSGDVTLSAGCGMTEGPQGEYCSLQVSDTALLDSERSIQKEFDDEHAKKTAPPAPKL